MSESDLQVRVQQRAADPHVDGIIVQLPLPRQINRRRILDAVPPQKDVDGLSTHSLALLRSGLTAHAGSPRFVPCAPAAVLHVLRATGVPVQGQRVTILGRGMLVGDPLYALLRSCAPAALSIADAHTPQEERRRMCLSSDIIISAVGSPNTVTRDMVHSNAVVIDVGTSRADYKHERRDGGYRTVGDVSADAYPYCAAYTPVPGGVGPVTVAMLLRNTLTAARCAMRDPI